MIGHFAYYGTRAGGLWHMHKALASAGFPGGLTATLAHSNDPIFSTSTTQLVINQPLLLALLLVPLPSLRGQMRGI